jgi:hypothetical protein
MQGYRFVVENGLPATSSNTTKGKDVKSEEARLLELLTIRGLKYETEGEEDYVQYVVYLDHGTHNDPERTIYGRGFPLIEALRTALWTVEVGSGEHP